MSALYFFSARDQDAQHVHEARGLYVLQDCLRPVGIVRNALSHARRVRWRDLGIIGRAAVQERRVKAARQKGRKEVTAANYWRDCKLFNFAGQEIGRARVPKDPFPPAVIQWANRYFILSLPDGNYGEVKCYLVPLENMSPPKPTEPALPHRKAER